MIICAISFLCQLCDLAFICGMGDGKMIKEILHSSEAKSFTIPSGAVDVTPRLYQAPFTELTTPHTSSICSDRTVLERAPVEYLAQCSGLGSG